MQIPIAIRWNGHIHYSEEEKSLIWDIYCTMSSKFQRVNGQGASKASIRVTVTFAVETIAIYGSL